MATQHKRPRDANQLAKKIVDPPAAEATETLPAPPRNLAAANNGRLGGVKGGNASAQALSNQERSRIAKKAALAKWKKA
jgi:hypothetical protein